MLLKVLVNAGVAARDAEEVVVVEDAVVVAVAVAGADVAVAAAVAVAVGLNFLLLQNWPIFSIFSCSGK